MIDHDSNANTPAIKQVKSDFANPFGYQGMWRDEHTGLYHTHYRLYDPQHVRWLTPDPAGYRDGQNLYRFYAGPNGVDVLGLDLDLIADDKDEVGDLYSTAKLEEMKATAVAYFLSAKTQTTRELGKLDTFATANGFSDFNALLDFSRETDSWNEKIANRNIAMQKAQEEASLFTAKDGAKLVGSALPIIGEAMDIETLFAEDSSALDRGVSVFSLALSGFTGSLAPNFGCIFKQTVKAIPTPGCFIKYAPLDDLGRSTGASARLDKAFVDNALGTSAKVDVGGMKKGMDRGHLIAKIMGGTGELAENLTPLYSHVNKGTMKAVENSIMSAIKRGETLDVIVTPIYKGNAKIPVGVSMYVKGSNGSLLNLTILNNANKLKYASKSAERKAKKAFKQQIEENFVK